MATKTFEVALNLDNPRIIQTGITVQSFDSDSIKISISLTKDCQPYYIPTGAIIRISILKLARQSQKIVVDVPNTNSEVIDWIVPDYLDGYQGAARIGVYLSGTENVDLGYFTILSNVSDIDKMTDEFLKDVFNGWEGLEYELQARNIVPEIIAARDGATSLRDRLNSDKAESLAKEIKFKTEIVEVNAQLAQKAEKGEVGSPLTANSVSDMTDTSRVYVNTTDGNWYSHNGTVWVVGGTYNSEGLGNGTVRPIHLTHEIKSDITCTKPLLLTFENNTYWNTETSVAVKNTFDGYYRTTEIETYGGQEFIISIHMGTSDKQETIVVTDDNYNILWKTQDVEVNTQLENYGLTIPANGTKLLLTDYSLFSNVEVKTVIYEGIASKSYLDSKLEHVIFNNEFEGESFSVLSDSTSAYIGHIPEGNAHYYNGSNSGVSDVSEMWWSVLAKKTGMTPLVINAWSGSKVSNIDLENNGFKPASVLSRAAGLHVGVNKPDNIIVKMGINDFSKSGADIGTWSGGSSLPPNNSDFSSAYAMMISRIRQAYPDARIFCLSLGIFIRTNTDKNGVEYNSERKTVYDYNNVIRKMCDLFGATYIDTQNIGITRQNIYPTYAEDYSSIPTHYNAAGHLLLGESVAKKIMQTAR